MKKTKFSYVKLVRIFKWLTIEIDNLFSYSSKKLIHLNFIKPLTRSLYTNNCPNLNILNKTKIIILYMLL